MATVLLDGVRPPSTGMDGELSGKRIAILVTDGVEEPELTVPRDAVLEAGATIDVVSPHGGEIQAMNNSIVFGLGMTAGNLIGGRLADQHESLGLVAGFAGVLVVLVVLGIGGRRPAILFPALFCVGGTMMMAIPTIQVRLTSFAPEAPTLMGALNLAALNVANALGAIGGSITIGAGLGTLSTVWAGFTLTAAGLALFALVLPRVPAMAHGAAAVESA